MQILFEVLHVKNLSPCMKEDIYDSSLYICWIDVYGHGLCDPLERGIKGFFLNSIGSD